jgi:hypothetical protein
VSESICVEDTDGHRRDAVCWIQAWVQGNRQTRGHPSKSMSTFAWELSKDPRVSNSLCGVALLKY